MRVSTHGLEVPSLNAGPPLRVLLESTGVMVRDYEGRRCGTVVAPLVDRETGAPRWLLVHLRAGFRALPVAGLIGGRTGLSTTHAASRVRDSVALDGTGALSARQEALLCRAYGIPPTPGALRASWERRRTTSKAVVAPDGTVMQVPERRAPTPAPRDRDRLGLLVAHPDPAVRGALADAARRLPARMVLCRAVGSGLEALRAVTEHVVDLAVVAVDLPLVDGPETVARLRHAHPSLTVALLTPGAGDPELVDPGTVIASDELPAGQILGALERLHYGAWPAS